MSQLSDFAEAAILESLLNKEAFTAFDSYLALFTVAPDDAGAGGTEVSGGAYARQQIFEATSGSTPRWNHAVASGIGQVVDNAQEIAFPQATANWGEVNAFGIYDAVTVGNLLWWGALADSPIDFHGLNAGDILHAVGHGFVNDDRVVLQRVAETALPTGLAEEVNYHVISSATDNFQVSLTQGGGAVVITADGHGLALATQWRNVQTNDTFKISAGNLDLILR